MVIMLVESPDGNRALLGRNKKFTPGMYTCLSGFIDQCESVEEVPPGGGRFICPALSQLFVYQDRR